MQNCAKNDAAEQHSAEHPQSSSGKRLRGLVDRVNVAAVDESLADFDDSSAEYISSSGTSSSEGEKSSADNDMSKKGAGEAVKVMEDDDGDGDDDGEHGGDDADGDDGDGDDLFRFTSLQSPACSLPNMQYITAGLILGNWTPRNTNI